MEMTTKVPLSERINVRLIVFSIVALFLVGTPIYWYVDQVVTGGIKQRGDVTEVNLMAMVTFPFDQQNGTVSDVPPQWRGLNGKKVQLVGEMYLANSAGDELNKFELVYSISKCCASGPPQIQHFVQAKAKEGKTVPYYRGLVTVTGTLYVDVKKGPEKVEQVFRLDVDSVQEGA